jgi:hypothetical protein
MTNPTKTAADWRNSRQACRERASFETLENRTLMSATWGTDDTVPNSGDINGMVADRAGNIYAVGIDGNTNNGLIREKAAGSTTWTTIFAPTSNGPRLTSAAVDGSGNLFVGGYTSAWVVLERPAPTLANPQPAFQTIDTFTTGWSGNICNGLATDAAGNVIAVGQIANNKRYWGVRKGTYSSATAKWTFATVDQFVADGGSVGVTIVNSGASAGEYVVGKSGTNWTVRKSVNGGSTWSTVDSFRYDTVGTASSYPKAVTSDVSGNVYVVGGGYTSVITGYAKNHTPIYSNSASHWLVRKSASGNSGSWSLNDDFPSPVGSFAEAAGVDLAGNVYVAGDALDANGFDHAIVRTNIGGSWSTSDDFFSADGSADYSYRAFAVDPATGTLYAGGTFSDYNTYDSGWLIRSAASPTALATTATFSSSPITLGSASANSLLDMLT